MTTIKTILTAALMLTLSGVGCGGAKAPEAKPSGDKSPGGETPGTETADKVVLSADRSQDTYTLIRSKGFNPDESPDLCAGNHQVGRHISQVYDQTLGKDVFVFTIHAQEDKDRDKSDITDRQRNEIKTDNKSPEDMRGSEGERFHLSWKFMLPKGFIPTSSFCHIHQLKGISGSDVSQPVITFTARYNSKGNLLQVIHNGADGQGYNNYLAAVPLADFLGEWVQVDEWATFLHAGSYKLVITRIRDGKKLVEIDQAADMWRDGAGDIRPKWGIYRSIGANGSLLSTLRDEELRFADFGISQLD